MEIATLSYALVGSIHWPPAHATGSAPLASLPCGKVGRTVGASLPRDLIDHRAT